MQRGLKDPMPGRGKKRAMPVSQCKED